MTDQLTVLDNLVDRLNLIVEEINRPLSRQGEFDKDVAEVATLLAGLEKISSLLSDTFKDIDRSLLNMRSEQETHKARLEDSLETVITILKNYPEVFVKLDIETIRMFLSNVADDVLIEAITGADEVTLAKWRTIALSL